MKSFGTILGLLIWSGLLVLQGTPGPTEEIAKDVVYASHPSADIYEVKETTIEDTAVYQIAYVDQESAANGNMAIAVEDGRIISRPAV